MRSLQKHRDKQEQKGRNGHTGEATLSSISKIQEPKKIREIIRALGKGKHPEAENELLRFEKKELALPEQRALAEALGKCGTEKSLSLLTTFSLQADPLLQKLAKQAILRLKAKQSRFSSSLLSDQMALQEPWPLLFRCREGIETLLLEEMTALALGEDLCIISPGKVRALWQHPLSFLWEARLFTDFAFLLPFSQNIPLEAAVIDALSQKKVLSFFSHLQSGKIRYRLDFLQGGHKRAAVRKIAQALYERNSCFLNDPQQSTWDFQINEAASWIEMVPKGLKDPRFFYRESMVPASSHKTLAAALAWVARPQAQDVIWDPFLGAGSELIEIALRYPYRALYGSDQDSTALQAAWQNMKIASVEARLAEQDALNKAPPQVSFIVTNPPMGKRVPSLDIHELLEAFLQHAYQVLPKQGRLVWISPFPEEHLALAKRLGFTVLSQHKVDMNGFWAELQSFQKEI